MENVEIPRAVRVDETLKKKIRILMALRGRNMQSQVRFSLMRAVDDEIAEIGKPAFDLLCEATLEIQPRAPKTLERVGNRKERLEKTA
jgi:hypothetical protein